MHQKGANSMAVSVLCHEKPLEVVSSTEILEMQAAWNLPSTRDLLAWVKLDCTMPNMCSFEPINFV